jgi:hypothetical protein
VRPAKPLKPPRDLRVIQVPAIAAVRADQLEHAGVAAFETAVHDAGRPAPQDRLAAVAGPTCGRGGHNLFRHDAQPRVMAITRARCRDADRTATSHDVRIAGTAHSTHRQEVEPDRYRGLEQRRRLSRDISTRAVRGNPSRVPTVPIHRMLSNCWLAVFALEASDVIIAVFPRAYHCAGLRMEMWVSSPEPRAGPGAARLPETGREMVTRTRASRCRQPRATDL